MNQIIEFDRTLFTHINGVWTHPVLDGLMPVLTDLHKQHWVTFGLLPLLLAFWLYKQRLRAVKALVLVSLSIALSDAVAYRIIKPSVERLRPAHSGVPVQLRTDDHSGKSFPSNHAANNFAAARTLGLAMPSYKWLFLLIAALVAYSRIYVGVHFPLDVVGGAALGLFMATLVWRAYGGRWFKNGAGSARERS